MISGRKYQGRSGFRHFTRWVKSVKQAKFRLPDIQPVYLKKTAQFRKDSLCFFLQLMALRIVCGLSPDVRQCRFIDPIRFGGSFPYISGLNEKIVQKTHFITDERILDRLLSELSETAGMLIRNRLFRFQQ
jgi:hypothetical protein